MSLGFAIAKNLSTAIETKKKADVYPPDQANVPPVTKVHRTSPDTPVGCVNVPLKINNGVKKTSNIMSEMARLTRR